MRVINVRRRTLAVAAGLVFLMGTGLSVAQATQGNPEHQVWICHATDSDTNPYRIIHPDVASAKSEGHLMHKTEPNKIWKSDGTFGGAVHSDGQPKPDIIGDVDAESAPAECYDMPTETETTSTTPPTETETTSTTPPTTSTTSPTETEATSTTPPTTSTTPPGVVEVTETAQPAEVVPEVVGGAVVTGDPVVAPATVTELAFSGAESVQLGLSGLLAMLLGAGVVATARRKRSRANN